MGMTTTCCGRAVLGHLAVGPGFQISALVGDVAVPAVEVAVERLGQAAGVVAVFAIHAATSREKK